MLVAQPGFLVGAERGGTNEQQPFNPYRQNLEALDGRAICAALVYSLEPRSWVITCEPGSASWTQA